MNLLGRPVDARVEKRDGQVLGPHKATFAGSTIIILDRMADIETGDTILRQLPNGKDERSVVTEALFFDQSLSHIGPHYQVKFRKGGESTAQRTTQNIHIASAQSIQIGDNNTQSIVNSFEALVKMIDSSGASSSEKEEAKSRLNKFFEHPLVGSIVGGVVGAASGAVVGRG